MITVAIMINGNPIMARSAYNTGEKTSEGLTIYQCDDGSKIEHDYDDGAVALSRKLLDTIHEDK